MIELKNISKIYKSEEVFYALRDVNLKIQDGEFVAVTGPSGSGKSTLLNILGFMDMFSEGQYLFNGSDISSLSKTQIHMLRKQNISYIFQNFAMMGHYTIGENVEIPLIAQGMGRRSRKQKVRESLEKVGILDQIDKLPAKVSGGQKQRCAIARALASGAGILLADEPTGSLDSKSGEEIMNLFEQLHMEGKTIILVTHDPKIAEKADRIIRVEDGFVYENR